MKHIVIFIVILLSLILVGCSSDIDNLKDEARILIFNENYTEALVVLEKIIELDSEDEFTYNSLSITYDSTGEYELALEAGLKALELGEKTTVEYSNIGNVYFHLGQILEARDSYNQALLLNDKNEYAIYGLGQYYKKIKDYEKALEYFIIYNEYRPLEIDGIKSLVFSYFELGKIDLAIQLLETELSKYRSEDLDELLKTLYDFRSKKSE